MWVCLVLRQSQGKYTLVTGVAIMSKDLLASKKPGRVESEVWRQHLLWMEVVVKEAADNIQKIEREPRSEGRRVKPS